MRGQDITVLIMCVLMLGAFVFMRVQGRKAQEAPDHRPDEGAGGRDEDEQ